MPAMSGASRTASAAPQMSIGQQNALIRSVILRGGNLGGINFPPAVSMSQQLNPILPGSIVPGSILTVPLRNVGLVKRLILEISGTITAGASSTQTLAPLGLANLISNVQFIDLGNQTRINSTGWHLNVVSTAKRRRVYGAAFTSDTPNGFGNVNNRTMYAPASISANASTTFRLMLEIPFTRDDTDLRGAIYGDVTNAVMQVQVQFNPTMFVTSAQDPTLAVYQSGGTDLATLSGVSVQANQMYLDQLPRNPKTGGPYLPPLDIGTAYLLNNTPGGLPVAGQDNGYAFVNARSYMSCAFIFDNAGTLNVNGSDLNYVAIRSANFTNILQYDGPMLALMERDLIGDDFPKGMHFLPFWDRPINTDQYGNMQIVLNPSSVGGASATFLFGWEAYGIIGQVNQGGSLPS